MLIFISVMVFMLATIIYMIIDSNQKQKTEYQLIFLTDAITTLQQDWNNQTKHTVNLLDTKVSAMEKYFNIGLYLQDQLYYKIKSKQDKVKK